jgi:hypothetical protein
MRLMFAALAARVTRDLLTPRAIAAAHRSHEVVSLVEKRFCPSCAPPG